MTRYFEWFIEVPMPKVELVYLFDLLALRRKTVNTICKSDKN